MERVIDDGSNFILEHEKVIASVIWKNFSKFANKYSQFDELMQIGRFELLKCRETYKPGEASFETYAYKCIYYKMLTYITRYNNTIIKNEADSINDLITSEDVIFIMEDDFSKVDGIYNDILKLVSTLDIVTQKIVYYTLKGYNQREISKILKIKERSVNNKVYRLREIISKEFNINPNNTHNKTNGKVIALELDGNFIGKYENLNEAEEMLGCDKNTIRKLAQKIKGRKSVYSKVLKRKITFKWG